MKSVLLKSESSVYNTIETLSLLLYVVIIVFSSFCSFSFHIWDFVFAFKLFCLVDEINKLIYKTLYIVL